MKRTLNIYNKDTKVGIIELDDNNEYHLFYDDNWIKNGYALSNHLALDNKEHNTDAVKIFIANLLPEGVPLEELTMYYSISKSDKFGLLKKIGAETSGAFTFITDAEKEANITSFRVIEKDELAQRIKDRKNIPITVWDKKPRVSVAGVQDKLPITMIGEQYGLGSGNICSTHILKFGKEEYVFNEYLSLILAKDAGIDVNKAELINFNGEYALRVERFDRYIEDEKNISKLHLLDSCQMLNLPPEFKYEKVEARAQERLGVNISSLFKLCDLTNIPIDTKAKILDWIIVNLCLANADAHGKNISFLVNANGITLAPFYDIMNISLLAHKYKDSLAMAIDDEFIILNIKAFDLKEFAKENNIKITLLKKRFNIIIKKIRDSLDNPNRHGFEDSLEKKQFFEDYKKNTISRLDILSKVSHYLTFPEPENFDKFLKANKLKIDKSIHKNEMKYKSSGEIIDLYFKETFIT